MITSFAELVALLDRQHVPHQTAAERGMVAIPTALRGIDGVQLLRWRAADGVLQLDQSIPVEVAADRVTVVESAIVYLNHALPMPGLDFAHPSRRLTYRLVLSLAPRGGVDDPLIEAYFRAAVRIGTGLVPTLRDVVSGACTPADAPAHAQANLAADLATGESTRPARSPPLDELLRLFPID